MAYFQSIII